MDAARRNRYGHRNATMILVPSGMGCARRNWSALRWEQFSFEQATLHVRRVKQGTASVHPLSGPELRAPRRLQRESVASHRGTIVYAKHQ